MEKKKTCLVSTCGTAFSHPLTSYHTYQVLLYEVYSTAGAVDLRRLYMVQQQQQVVHIL